MNRIGMIISQCLTVVCPAPFTPTCARGVNDISISMTRELGHLLTHTAALIIVVPCDDMVTGTCSNIILRIEFHE